MTASTMVPSDRPRIPLLRQTAVKGGSSGIGLATARRARAERADVVRAVARADTKVSTDTIVQ